MSLDKAIKHRKEKRKEFYDRARRFDPSCRSHGACPYCRNNRLHKVKRQQPLEEDKC